MPDLTVGIKVIGAQQAAGQLNQVGTAAASAGSKAQTAGSGFSNMGSRIGGAVAGIGLLSAGLFGLDDAFDSITKAESARDKAQARASEKTEKRIKAEQELKAAVSGGATMQRNANGEVSIAITKKEDIAALTDKYNDALRD